MQQSISTVCQKISSTATSAVQYVSTQTSRVGHYLADLASKVASAVGPVLEKIKNFATQNKSPILIGVAVIAGLAMIWAAIKCCYRGGPAASSIQGATNMPPAAAPAPVAPAAP